MDNSHPLVFVDNDIKSSHVLTPSDFLLIMSSKDAAGAIRMQIMKKLQNDQQPVNSLMYGNMDKETWTFLGYGELSIC